MEEKSSLKEEAHLLSSQRKARGKRSALLCLILFLAILLIVAVALALTLGLHYGLDNDDSSDAERGSSGTYEHGAVATDAAPCSTVGADILRKGGSAVDAAIASLLCVGVVNLHSTGIGGGGFMVYYNATSKIATTIDYRETAPLRANSSLYEPFGPNQTESLYGGLAIAVPAEVKGFELAHQKFGKLSWDKLFEPAASIADNGFTVTPAIAAAINAMKDTIIKGNYTDLQELLAPNGVWLGEGDPMYRKKYAETLRAIGAQGASYFYSGEFLTRMVAELKENGAILEEDDFLQYNATEREPIVSDFDGLKMIGSPPPSSGPVLALILNILQGYDFKKEDFGSLAYHRIVEAFKFGFGQRLRLGDPAFNSTIQEVVDYMLLNTTADEMRSMIEDNTTHDPEYYREANDVFYIPSDYGTSHLSVLAPDGDAVGATNTINSFFGSLIRSKTSGVIFNDEMDDFAIPTRGNPSYLIPTVPNYIEPGKRPQSSTTPTILVDEDGRVKMVVGASGGTKITTATAQVILDVFDFEKELSEAVPLPRLHHQLYPNYVRVEKKFPQKYREGLKERGHEIVESSSYAVVQGIIRSGGLIHATSDYRKGGKPDGF